MKVLLSSFHLNAKKEIFYFSADDSMKVLFNDGNGSVYKTCVSWLSSGDEHLEVSGCLAIGNFGRTGQGLKCSLVPVFN